MKRIMSKSILLGCILLGVCVCMFGMLVPQAYAADFPSSTQGSATTAPNGNVASTNVNVKVTDTQLSFTAPSTINFAMKSDGSFICPSDGAAQIKNNSVMPIKVISYEISNSGSSAVGVESVEGATDDNSYQLKVKPNSGSAVCFSVSKTGTNVLSSDWIMQKSGSASSADTLALSFLEGKMVNISSNTWGAENGSLLQTVTWTVSADTTK